MSTTREVVAALAAASVVVAAAAARIRRSLVGDDPSTPDDQPAPVETARTLIDPDRLLDVKRALADATTGDPVGERRARETLAALSARERGAVAVMAADDHDVEMQRLAAALLDEARRRQRLGEQFLASDDEAERDRLLRLGLNLPD